VLFNIVQLVVGYSNKDFGIKNTGNNDQLIVSKNLLQKAENELITPETLAI